MHVLVYYLPKFPQPQQILAMRHLLQDGGGYAAKVRELYVPALKSNNNNVCVEREDLVQKKEIDEDDKYLKTGPAFLRKVNAPAPILFQPLPYMCASQPYVVVVCKRMNYTKLVLH